MPPVKFVYSKNRKEWRAWLEKNHNKEKKIALIVYKNHTGRPSLNHKESMEEAICFGWIDTTINRLDEDRYLRNFSKRTDKSKWSKNTLRYARELIAKGKMSEEGIKRYKEGVAKHAHDEGIPKNPKVPDYLKKEIEKNKIAKENFKKIAPSYRKTLLRWLLKAKLEKTKNKRIKIIIQSLKKGSKLYPAA